VINGKVFVGFGTSNVLADYFKIEIQDIRGIGYRSIGHEGVDEYLIGALCVYARMVFSYTIESLASSKPCKPH
jgi:hypothetical protein